MSDEELLVLLKTKTAEELTSAEIAAIRKRLADSSSLREALATQLQLDASLHEALGPIQAPADTLADRVESHRRVVIVALPFVFVLLLIPAGIAVFLTNRPGDVDVGGQQEDLERDTPRPEPQPAFKPPSTAQASDVQIPAGGKQDNDPPVEATLPEKTNATTAPPAPAAEPPPWQAAIDMQGELPEYRQVALGAVGAAESPMLPEALSRWFGRVHGTSFRLGQVETRHGKAGTIEGIGRLLSPWPNDSVLQLTLENHNRLRIHLFHEDRGVSLVYYEDAGHAWAAYVTTRERDHATPGAWHLTATDGERGKRTQLRFGGPVELRYHKGDVILSRGDIVLVSAPLPGSPTEVFFDGRATVLNLALVRARGVPHLEERRTVVYDSDRPADLDWNSTRQEAARFERLASGAVRLTADNIDRRTSVQVPIPAVGLNDVIVKLADVTPGTGVFLGRGEGQVHEVVRFYRDSKSGHLAARLHGWDDQWEADFGSPAERLVPLVQPELWVRMLAGCGNFQWWVSSDGKHWAQVQAPHEPATPEVTSIGLQAVARRPGTQITLQRIVLRRLDGLAALADSQLVEQAPPILTASSPGTWLAESLRVKPAEVDTDEWLRACSVRALAGGAHRDVAYAILEGLLDDAAGRGLPIESQLAALEDAAALCGDLRDEQRMRRGVLSRYADLGQMASDKHGLGAWSSVRRSYLSLATSGRHQSPVNLDQVLRDDLVRAVHHHAPDELLDVVRELRLFELHRDQPLVDWAESLALRATPRQAVGGIARIKDSWREPLIEELSKDTYTALTELEALLESEAWDEAASLVTSIDADLATGVAPYFGDKSLLTSLPVAIQLTLDDYPQLRESLGGQFAALAQLRLAQAMDAADADAIELVSIQFAGTPAAAEAHRWLGDRALASGWFERAISEYERAQAILPSLGAELYPRMRLAAAMLGRDWQAPVTQSVQLGDLTLSAEEFEALVTEMRGRPQKAELATVPSEPVRVPLPCSFEAHIRSRLDGPAGEKPDEEVGRRTNQYRVPWVDRQIATTVEGSTLYVTNRFQVAAYDLETGQRLWQSQQPPGNMRRSQDWAMIPMRPLVTPDRIYVRLLYTANPLLVCLEKSSGKLLWMTETADREHLVSDPVMVQGQIVALAIALHADQQGILRWYAFDPHSGEVVQQRDLLRLRNTWGARSCCQMTPLESGLLVALGGITLAIDPAGNVRWLRSHVTLPADEDPRWVLQMYQPPVVRNKAAFTAQPGMRSVVCLATETGRQHWSAVLPDVVGIVGVAGQTLVVRTEHDLCGLRTDDGQVLWRFAAETLHSYQLLDDERLLIATRERQPTNNERWQTRFTWLDPHSGQPIATTLVPSLDDHDPRLGPLVPFKGRLFVFFGRGQHDPHRDIVELIPMGEAVAAIAPTAIEPWRTHLPERLRASTAELLDSWQLVSGQAGDRTGLVEEVHGEGRALGLRATGAGPIVLAREVTLPQVGGPRLRVRLGRDGGQRWKVKVYHGDKLLKMEEIKDETHADRWQTLDVDLTSAAGQSGWLSVWAESVGGDHVLYFRNAEISF